MSGAPPEYWWAENCGRRFPEDWAESAEERDRTDRWRGCRPCPRDHGRWRHPLGGRAHKPYYETDGRQNGFVASLRVIDNEVAAQQELEEARRLLAASADSMLDPQMLLEVSAIPPGEWWT